MVKPSITLLALLALASWVVGPAEAAPSLKALGTYLCPATERCEVLAVGPLLAQGVAVLIGGKSQNQAAGIARIVLCASDGKPCRKVDQWSTEAVLHRLDVSMLAVPGGVEVVTRDSESSTHLRTVDHRGAVTLHKLPFSLGARLVASDGQRKMIVRGYPSGIGLVDGDIGAEMRSLQIVDGISIENLISIKKMGADAVYARLLPGATAQAPKAVVERLSKAGLLRCQYTVDGVPEELAAWGSREAILFNNIDSKGDNAWSVGLASCASAKLVAAVVPLPPERVKSAAMACAARCAVGVLTRSRYEILDISPQDNGLKFTREVDFIVPAGEVLGGIVMAADANDTIVVTAGTVLAGRDLVSSIKVFRVVR